MADIHARMRQLIQSTADWGATDPVLGRGEIGFERQLSGEVKSRIGDGVKHWSALAEWPAPAAAPMVTNKHDPIALGRVSSLGVAQGNVQGFTCSRKSVGEYTIHLSRAASNQLNVVAQVTIVSNVGYKSSATFSVPNASTINVHLGGGDRYDPHDFDFSIAAWDVG